jgi:hypothetical protein
LAEGAFPTEGALPTEGAEPTDGVDPIGGVGKPHVDAKRYRAGMGASAGNRARGDAVG